MGQNSLALPVIVAETDVGAVGSAATSSGGWVSGTPASLADGASATVIFDMGINWRHYGTVALSILSTTATSLSDIQVISADTAALPSPVTKRLKELNTPTSGTALAGSLYVVTTANGSQSGLFRPMGRYVIVRCTNTAAGGVQGAGSKICFAAYPY